jgi:hypothetical protein
MLRTRIASRGAIQIAEPASRGIYAGRRSKSALRVIEHCPHLQADRGNRRVYLLGNRVWFSTVGHLPRGLLSRFFALGMSVFG